MSAVWDTIEFVAGPDPMAQPVATVVVLHGLGADGNDFVPVAQAMDLSALGPVRFVFPNAPVRPVTVNGGYAMPAWYDIYPPSTQPDVPRREDVAGLRQSQTQVQALLDREAARGVPPERTVLMGFSQGCAMSLLTGLRAPRRLGGIVGLSGYLPLAASTASERSAANARTPVFLAHGRHDSMVVPSRGEAARDALLALGYSVHWRTYAMEHSVCPEEIADLNTWLLGVFSHPD